MNELLNGIYDLHIHTAPDVSPRKCTDLELAQRLINSGMKGCALKCHFEDTAARAFLLQKLYPQLHVAGGIALNRSVGGLNPDAVERCAQMGGRFVWFPTLEALAYQRFRHANDPDVDFSPYIPVLGPDGRLLPAAAEVLETAASHHMVVGTGHISAEEGLALVQEASHLGCQMVLTHCDNPADCYSLEQQQAAVKMGAYIEHSFFTTYYNRTPIEEIARQIRGVGCEHVLLTTDFGQVNSPHSDEGMAQYSQLLLDQGFRMDEIFTMTRTNPEKLLGIY